MTDTALTAAHTSDPAPVPADPNPPTPAIVIDAAKAAKLRALIRARADAERTLAAAGREHEELRELVAQLRAENTTLRREDVSARDPRARHIWIAAARAAIDDDYCQQYDNIADSVGGFTRDELRDGGWLDQTYRVRTLVTIELHLDIDASSEDQAIDRIDDLGHHELATRLRHEFGTAADQFEVESWDAREAETA